MSDGGGGSEAGRGGVPRVPPVRRVRRAPVPPVVPAGPLGREVLELLAAVNRLEAQVTSKLREFDASGEWRLDGAVSAQGWLRHHGRMTGSAASGRIRAARRLPELPATARAFHTGEISREHVSVIVQGTEFTEGLDGSTTVDTDAIAEAVAAGEKIFVDAARDMDPANLRKVATHYRHAVEPQVVVADEIESVSRRSLHMSQSLDGRYHLKGEFDAEGGTVVKTALDALMPPDGENGGHGRASRRWDPADTPPRSASRRRADALVTLAHTTLDTGTLPMAGGERPHLSVIVDLETLEGRGGAPAAELDDGVVLSGEADGRLDVKPP